MSFSGTHWPEGLNDEEALQRLQTICRGACDGIQDLSDDTRYQALRRTLLGRRDLRRLAPAFLAAQHNLEAFVRPFAKPQIAPSGERWFASKSNRSGTQ